jgi:hypothetical protein
MYYAWLKSLGKLRTTKFYMQKIKQKKKHVTII